jgi:hypothetical protein
MVRVLSTSFDGVPAWRYGLRLLWAALQVYLVICLGQRGVLFFYQAF